MTKISTKAKNQIDKNSLHFRIASWSLKNPKIFKLGLIGAGFFVLCMFPITYLLSQRTSSNVVYRTTKELVQIPGTASTWTLLSKQTTSEGTECRRYRKSNNVEMTSCYQWTGKEWKLLTSY